MSDEIRITDPDEGEEIHVPDVLPVMALRDVVVFPYAIVPLSVGRERSSAAIDAALAGDRLILLVTQRSSEVEEPAAADLYGVGCVGAIMRMLKLPDGTIRVLVQGIARARVDYLTQEEPHLQARLSRLDDVGEVGEEADLEREALARSVKEGLERIAGMGRQISPEVLLIASNLDDPLRLADLVASNLSLKVEDGQRVLETRNALERLQLVAELLGQEISLLEMQQQISSQVRSEMDRGQREYFLRQQLRAIQKELGESDDLEAEIAEYGERIERMELPEEASDEIAKQISRLRGMQSDSAESSVIRTWLDWMTTLPWSETSEDLLDLARARTVLDEDHYDLERIKERIVEFLAVRSLKPDGKGPILCFVGPPGVGKTSLGRSIARAMGRRFVRLSLGGVRDEAEIRGHRRTYVGAMPGRIVQGIQQAGTANPVFMLDEIDKIGADFRGDPSSALLEVLDPEQNHTFRDHYLGVPFDLSRTLFIATANVTETIQPAFLDRMETIRLSGYSEEQKIEIARRHLLPKQIEENGLAEVGLDLTTPALRLLIDGYTRESGLRNLERRIGAVARKVAVGVAGGDRRRRRITPRTVETMLGPREHLPEERLREDAVGVATGLAWTPFGGEILFVEALAVRGKGDFTLTGFLGDVMKESARAAYSWAKAHGGRWGIADGWFDEHVLHVHVPAGAIPKDGPSAGVAMLTAIVSVAAGRTVRRDLAMTGEITLRGDVLPVGGVKEKALAALRADVTRLLLPRPNERDLVDLPPKARRALDIELVDGAAAVLDAALGEPPDGGPSSGQSRSRRSRK